MSCCRRGQDVSSNASGRGCRRRRRRRRRCLDCRSLDVLHCGCRHHRSPRGRPEATHLLSVCLFVCLFVYLLSVCRFVRLSVWVSNDHLASFVTTTKHNSRMYPLFISPSSRQTPPDVCINPRWICWSLVHYDCMSVTEWCSFLGVGRCISYLGKFKWSPWDSSQDSEAWDCVLSDN